MEWLLAFALGLLCAWVLLRALKWLPVVVVLGVLVGEARANFCVTGTEASGVTYNALNATFGVWMQGNSASSGWTGNSAHCNTSGQWTGAGATIQLWVSCGGVDTHVGDVTSGNVSHTIGGNCANGGWYIDTPSSYYGNYCITNTTGHGATFKFCDNCGNCQTMNLGPGMPWCVTYTNTDLACFPVQFSWSQWDGTGQNWGPSQGPNGTNSPPGSPGVVPAPSPAPGPDPGSGPSGTNGATGGDIGRLQTNLTYVMNYNGGYLGNVIGTFGMNASNQASVQILQFSMMTNELASIVTNTGAGGTNSDSPYFKYLTNLPDIKSELVAATNYLASITNLLTNYDNMFGSNRFGVGGMYSTGGVAVTWSYAGTSNSGHGIAVAYTNAVGTNVQQYLDVVGAISNFSVAAENGSLWLIPMATNLGRTGYTGTTSGSSLDLNPLHQSWFVASAGWVRIIAYWAIVAAYLRWAYDLFYDRAAQAMGIVSENAKSDLGILMTVQRLAFWGTLMVGFPATAMAIIKSWQGWPGAAGMPVSPFSGATLAGFGAWGTLFAESIAMVDSFFPLLFAASVLASMVAVRLAVDSITLFLMAKLKWV